MILKLNGMKTIKIKMMNKFIYQIWFWIGCKCSLFREYNIQRDKSLKNAKEQLEKAFTPRLKQMLLDKLNVD